MSKSEKTLRTRRNFLPDGHNQLDWMQLAADPTAAFSWIKSLLLKEQATVYLDGAGEQASFLWHLFVEQRLRQRTEARPALYFCYPYFTASIDSMQHSEPLLRWPCQLVPPTINEPRWQLKVNSPVQAEWNKDWAAWATHLFPADWAAKLSTVSQAPNLLKALTDFAISFTEETSWTTPSAQPAISSFSGISQMQEEAEAGQLSWLATLGIYENFFTNVSEVADQWLEPILEEEGALSYHYLTRSDPFQYSALRTASRFRHLLVSGQAGSGKSSLGKKAIDIALLQGKRCLWVSKDSAQLTRAHEQFDLENAPLSSFYLRDERTDLPLLQRQIQAFAKETKTNTAELSGKWDLALGRIKRQQNQLTESYTSTRQTVFGEQSWASILGYYLASSRQEGKALLNSQLTTAQFNFEPREYQSILSGIRTTAPIFEESGAPETALKNLNAAIFIHQTEEESRQFIATNAADFLTKAQTLHQKFLKKQSQYADQYQAFLLESYQMLRVQHHHTQDLLEDGLNEMGADVFRSGDGTLKIYGAFSSKFRNVIKHRESLQRSWDDLKKLHEEHRFFEIEWGNDKILRQPILLADKLRQYGEKLEDWRKGLNTKVQEENLRLNHKTAHPDLSITQSIEKLEMELDQFIDDINGAGLYQLPIRSKMLTLQKQQRHLEEIIAQITQTEQGMGRFAAYYQWQKNWFSLSETSRKVLSALIKSRAQNWEAAFNSWYFSECLAMEYRPSTMVDDQLLNDFRDKLSLLRPQSKQVTHNFWIKSKTNALSALRSLNRQKELSAKAVFEKNGEPLTAFYPVWFTTPRYAAALAPHFDLLIIDDVQSIPVQEAEAILSKAKQSVLLYDEGQGGSSNNLREILSRKDMPAVQLGEHYLPSFAAKLAKPDTQISFHQVGGRFDMQKESNSAEAEAVLKILNSIQPTQQRTYPKVGVVTMTKGQRNLIWQLFYDIKKRKLPGFEVIQQLERNGLEILSTSDLAGQEFDDLIFSGTYGILNIENDLGDQLSVLNIVEEKAKLNILKQKFPQNITIINSVPLQEFEARLTWKTNTGEQLFSGIMLSLFAASNNKTGELFRIEKLLAKEKQVQAFENDSLAREISLRLLQHLPKWAWAWQKIDGINTPILILTSPNSNKYVLPLDGFVAQAPQTNFAWEAEAFLRLRAIGYKIVPVSIDQLWHDAAKTCLRLSQKLKAMELLEEEE